MSSEGRTSKGTGESEMRIIGRCGLTILVAAIGMAFLGASSAMAETSALCKSNESGQPICAAGNQLGELHYVSSEMKILNGLQNVTCESLFKGTAWGLFTNEPVKITGKFTYFNCNGSCEVEQITEGEFKLLKTTATEGVMVGTGVKFKVACLFINCVYTWEGLGVGATSANLPTTAGKWIVTEQELERTPGGTCPMTTKLHMAMESLTDVYIKR
jgi:hypothetical protein